RTGTSPVMLLTGLAAPCAGTGGALAAILVAVRVRAQVDDMHRPPRFFDEVAEAIAVRQVDLPDAPVAHLLDASALQAEGVGGMLRQETIEQTPCRALHAGSGALHGPPLPGPDRHLVRLLLRLPGAIQQRPLPAHEVGIF